MRPVELARFQALRFHFLNVIFIISTRSGRGLFEMGTVGVLIAIFGICGQVVRGHRERRLEALLGEILEPGLPLTLLLLTQKTIFMDLHIEFGPLVVSIRRFEIRRIFLNG